jgi:putative SOS response-associated peptidase YedK
LVSHWAKEEKIGHKMINARSETAAEKPAFRGPLRCRRCVIPVSSFFEWKKEGKGKLPYNIRLKSNEPFVLAGLWDKWKSPEGVTIESCTILTTGANPLVSGLHDRMPVILHREEIDLWLSLDVQEAEPLFPLFYPYPADLMEMYPVSSLVNAPANDAPECVAPA